ncbi:MAG: hypothetical protein M1354_02915 [Candidatus Marsarchaeota archaeon]|jgi:hypothetical protein|nr:hypothetical protein [Candidatus Marsarchaeota archaeon]
MAKTYVISRIKLEKILSTFRISTKNSDEMLNQINKTHRHINAVAFVSMMHRYGVGQADMANMLRRIGFDDVTITEVFNMLDEQRINETYGKIVELDVD